MSHATIGQIGTRSSRCFARDVRKTCSSLLIVALLVGCAHLVDSEVTACPQCGVILAKYVHTSTLPLSTDESLTVALYKDGSRVQSRVVRIIDAVAFDALPRGEYSVGAEGGNIASSTIGVLVVTDSTSLVPLYSANLSPHRWRGAVVAAYNIDSLGSVVGQLRTTGPSSEPLACGPATLRMLSGHDGETIWSTRTDSLGSFSIRGIIPGIYTLDARATCDPHSTIGHYSRTIVGLRVRPRHPSEVDAVLACTNRSVACDVVNWDDR